VAEIDLDRCIGCGLCVTTCPTEAMLLQPKEKHYIPPLNTAEQMMAMAQERGLL
jgi:electron transport complex protein RnfB